MSKNTQMKIKISDDFCFKTSFPNIKETQQALRQYAETLDEPLNIPKQIKNTINR